MPLLRKKSTTSSTAMVVVESNFPTVPSEIISLILSYLELTNILKLSRVSHSFLEAMKQVQYINFTHLKISFHFEKIFRVLLPKFPQLQNIKFHSQINGFNFGFDNFIFLTETCPHLQVLDFHHCKYFRLENCEKGLLVLIQSYGKHLKSLNLRIDHLNVPILESLILHCFHLERFSIHASDYEFFKYDFPQIKWLPNSIPVISNDLNSILEWRCKIILYLIHVLLQQNQKMKHVRLDRFFDFVFEKTPTYGMITNNEESNCIVPQSYFLTDLLFQQEFVTFDVKSQFFTHLTHLQCFKMEHNDTNHAWFENWHSYFPKLIKYSIANCKLSSSVLSHLECHSQLQYLNMANVKLKESELSICHESLQILIATKCPCQSLQLHCPNLIKLDLESSEKLTLITFDTPCYKLKHVNLVKCTRLNDLSIQNICESCPQITQLKLLECRSLLEPQIENLKQLKLLYVIATKWETKHLFQLLITCPQVSQITFLGIKSELLPPVNAFQTFHCNDLNEICFSSCKQLSHECLSLLIEQCKNLSSFILRFNDSIENCFIKTKHSKLQHFEFKSCSKLTNHFIKQLVYYCPNVKSLRIVYCQNIGKLAFTSHSLVELKMEGLMNANLEDVKCKHVTELAIVSLNYLKFSEKMITFSTLFSIRLKHCLAMDGEDIRCLLSNCHLLKHLTIKYCKQIEHLELHSNSLQNLAIHHCSHLQTISLSNTLQEKLMEIVIKKCDKLNIEQFLNHLNNRRLSLNTYINYKSCMATLQNDENNTSQQVESTRNKKNCLVM